jgi:hypothetical protein
MKLTELGDKQRLLYATLVSKTSESKLLWKLGDARNRPFSYYTTFGAAPQYMISVTEGNGTNVMLSKNGGILDSFVTDDSALFTAIQNYCPDYITMYKDALRAIEKL